jgi:Lrp/AsnC family transcriptional regulator, leucine-responsive regulatory protein
MQVCLSQQVSMVQSTGLDHFDLAVLAIIQKDNTTPQRVIGEAINLSAPAVQRGSSA